MATVTDIITHRISDFDKPPFRQIVLLCNSDNLPNDFEATLTYSATWTKANLQVGDKIKFKAKVKRSTNHYYWAEKLSGKPVDMIEPEEEIEIINVKQITKI